MQPWSLPCLSVGLIAAVTLSSCGFGGGASGCPSFEGRTDDLQVGGRQTITVQFVDGDWDDRLDAAGRYWITGDSTPPNAPVDGRASAEATLVGDQELAVEFDDGTTVRFEPFSCE